MNTILIKNIKIIDTKNEHKHTESKDILIKNGIFEQIGKNIICENADVIIDGTNLIASPGLCDIHTHMRDPGQTHKEDIITGSKAAAKGGFCDILAMPNTTPCCDNVETIHDINEKSKNASCRVHVVGCITKSMNSGELCDFAAFKKNGVVAVSDDGKCVDDAELMEKALLLGNELGLTVISHCEDMKIVNGGIVNKGFISEYLGVKGIDRESEDSITKREIEIAKRTNCHVHIAHVSTRGSVDLIRKAKADGVKITCETCPHYFIFTEKEDGLMNKNANFRMNPPLRTHDDKTAIIEGIVDGTIDAIITDHAPHSESEKADFEKAPNGIIGLETSLSASYSHLVKPKWITLKKLIELMSSNPLKIANLPEKQIKQGNCADLVIFNPDEKWIVKEEEIVSKSKNTPFLNHELDLVIKYTICDGHITYSYK